MAIRIEMGGLTLEIAMGDWGIELSIRIWELIGDWYWRLGISIRFGDWGSKWGD